MTASPIKTGFTLVVCSLMVLNNPGAAQACWLTDWLWGNNTEAYPVQPPVITTGYPVYPTTVNYAPSQGACQPSVVGSYPVTTAGYASQMNYDSRYQQVPTTVYRPTTVYQPTPGGVPAVGYQGCTTSRYQVQRIPAVGYAPAQSSCGGCGSTGYSAPAAPPQGGAVQAGPPTQWVPAQQSPSQQMQVPPPPSSQAPMSGYQNGAYQQSAPASGNGSSFTQPEQSLAPQQGNSRFSTPPADTRPQIPQDSAPMRSPGPGSGASIGGGGSVSRYIPPSVTSQRPATTNATPSSSASAPKPSTNPWHNTPVAPIPDPQISNSGSRDVAPRLLDPRDKTAGLDTRSTIVPVGYQMEQQPPQRTYRPPTASIQVDANGWGAPRR
ncbi:hypothetical protein [Blastopirellula marina]|uniref:hypothetical protein n=1 Tax=Blastopirellula marina TaxID=124 RepID=UPI0011B06AC1|nr:hypothetical protein [Blastopirellula marina]